MDLTRFRSLTKDYANQHSLTPMLNKQFLLTTWITMALSVIASRHNMTCADETPAVTSASPTDYLASLVEQCEVAWPKNKTINVVCHGHSVPAGYFKTPVVDSLNAYPHLLHSALKSRFPKAVINVVVTAIGGEDSVAGAKRFTTDVLSHRPQLVLIDYGLNDRRAGLEESRIAWQSMISACRENNIPVILLTPTADKRAKILSDDDPLSQHAEQIRSLAAKNEIGIADSYASIQAFLKKNGDIETIMSQVNHPNREGHEMVVTELVKWFDGPRKAATAD